MVVRTDVHMVESRMLSAQTAMGSTSYTHLAIYQGPSPELWGIWVLLASISYIFTSNHVCVYVCMCVFVRMYVLRLSHTWVRSHDEATRSCRLPLHVHFAVKFLASQTYNMKPTQSQHKGNKDSIRLYIYNIRTQHVYNTRCMWIVDEPMRTMKKLTRGQPGISLDYRSYLSLFM